ncbi:prohead assembly (scaffolding) protein [Citrobacter phage Ci1]|nr:prohead assembly (scaffolding) protein [Citrobacter phage Ci1]
MKQELLIETWGQPGNFTDADCLIESVTDKGTGALYLEGVFMQANVVNGNKRVYPKKVLEKSVSKYIQEQVNTRQALGELNHPPRPFVDPKEAAIIIEKLWWKGDDVYGRARIIEGDHGVGDKTAALIRAGWRPGVSSRGLGAVKKNSSGLNEVQDGFQLTVGVDVVWGPSAPNAYPKAFTENKEIEMPTQKNGADELFETLIRNLEKEIK